MENNNEILKLEKLLEGIKSEIKRLEKANKDIDNCLADENIKALIKVTKSHIEQIRIPPKRNSYHVNINRKINPNDYKKEIRKVDEWEFNGERYYDGSKLEGSISNYKSAQVEKKEKFKEEIEQHNLEIIDLKKRIATLRNNNKLGVNQSNRLVSSDRSREKKSSDTRIADIITFVSGWKNFEGNYTQNKLAIKLNIDKGTFSKWLKKEIIDENKIKPNKQLLIKRIREAIKILDEKKYSDNKKYQDGADRNSRLKKFLEELTNEQSKKDRSYGKKKGSSFNPYEEN